MYTYYHLVLKTTVIGFPSIVPLFIYLVHQTQNQAEGMVGQLTFCFLSSLTLWGLQFYMWGVGWTFFSSVASFPLWAQTHSFANVLTTNYKSNETFNTKCESRYLFMGQKLNLTQIRFHCFSDEWICFHKCPRIECFHPHCPGLSSCLIWNVEWRDVYIA